MAPARNRRKESKITTWKVIRGGNFLIEIVVKKQVKSINICKGALEYLCVIEKTVKKTLRALLRNVRVYFR